MKRASCIPFLTAAMTACCASALAQSLPVFDVPRLPGLVIGEGAAWPAEALTAELLSSPDSRLAPPDRFAATLRLAWTDQGLAVRVDVNDPAANESDNPRALHLGDSVELMLRPAPGEMDMVQWVVAPGRADQPQPRMGFIDRRGDLVGRGGPAPFTYTVHATEAGYTVEAVIGLESLDLHARPGQELGLQVIVNDRDDQGRSRRLTWHPFANAFAMPWAYQRVRLAEQASEIPPAGISYHRLEEARARVSVWALPDLAGQVVTVRQGDKPLGQATLAALDGRATARIDLVPPAYGDIADPLTVHLDQAVLAAMEPQPTVSNHWEMQIRAYERRDRETLPPTGAIVFIGSSSIGGWRTLTEDMAGLTVLGRGFGGSTIACSTHFVPRIVWPYKPRAVVMYAGGNDLGRKSPQQVAEDFDRFVRTVHWELPETPIYYISLKPTIHRRDRWDDEQHANRLIRDYAERNEGVEFIDITDAMLDADGEPLVEMLADDLHHPSREGYRVMGAIVRQRLIEDGHGDPPAAP